MPPLPFPFPPGRPGRLAAAGALLLSVLLAAAVTARWSGRSPLPDEGSFGTFGREILAGAVPYRDLVNEKLPLHYLLTAGWMAVDEPTFDAARRLAGVLLGLSSLLGAALAWRLTGRAAAALAVPPALALAAGPLCAFANVAEGLLAPLALGLALLVTGPEPDDRAAVRISLLSGILAALAFLAKPQYGILVAGAAGARLVAAPGSAGRRQAALVVGAFAAAAGAGLSLLALWSGPGPLWQATVGNLLETGAAGYRRPATASVALLLASLAGAIGVLAVAARRSPRLRPALPLVVAMLLPLLPRADAFRAWPLVAVLVPLLVAAGAPEVSALPRPARSFLVGATTLAAAAFLAVAIRPVDTPDPVMEAHRAAAARLSQLSRDGDAVWAGPHVPLLYLLSHRRPASRHLFLLPWVAGARARGELMNDLVSRPAAIIADASAFLPRSPSLATIVPELPPLLAVRYRDAGTVAGVRFFVLTVPTHPPPSRPEAR